MPGRAVNPDPRNPATARSHPEQRQVHVLLLFVAPSDYRGCFAGELCVL